jgi:hypothetical protein
MVYYDNETCSIKCNDDIKDDVSIYYSEEDSDECNMSDNDDDGFHKFKDMIERNVDAFCNVNDYDRDAFVSFLIQHVVTIVRYIVHDVKMNTEITHADCFEPVYQYIYEIYTEVFDDTEQSEMVFTDQRLELLKSN